MSGIEEWNRTIGGMQNEWGTCVKQLDSGQYVVAGYSSNGPFLMKTDYLGNVIWTKTYEGCKFESFGLTNDGGFIVVGQKNYCMFLMKTDGNGTEMWEDTYFPVPSPGSTVGTAVQQTKDEGFIVSGMITNLGGWMLLLKTNENGFEEWNTSFHGGVAFCVIQMTNDDYVIGGYWLPHQLETHFWMIQTDTHGGVIWNQTYMPSRFANCYSLQQTPDNGIIATGITDPYGGLSKCVVLKLVNENQQPNTPIIDGPTSCKPKITNQWNFTSNDPNGDDIFYQIDWSDGTPVTEWYGPYHSGETMSQSHSYNTKGTYTIKAKAKDIYGMESDWGTHPITVPCSYNIDTMQFWIQLFERFPHAFPILRQLLKY
jgi:hypothetical protein